MCACRTGEACIKAEYLVRDEDIAQAITAGASAKKVRPKEERKAAEELANDRPRKKGRFSAKERASNRKKVGKESLCVNIAVGGTCPEGDQCPHSHDIEAYLKEKPEDVDSTCWLFEQYGRCPYGLHCRFAGAHTNPETKEQVVKEDANAPYLANSKASVLSTDTMHALRKNEYVFKFADDASEKVNELMDRVWPLDMAEQLVPFPVAEMDFVEGRPSRRELKPLDLQGKYYLAPLTTVGNLPFRRLCVRYGADITCGEMAMADKVVEGYKQEWALLQKHESEKQFGVQLCGKDPRVLSRACELIETEIGGDGVNFIDLNCGCPIDLVFNQGYGSALTERPRRLETLIQAMTACSSLPVTMKIRTGISNHKPRALDLITRAQSWGLSAITLHGRSRTARYSKRADWDYIAKCAAASTSVPLIGNGDIFSPMDIEQHAQETNCGAFMVARGALVKPWVFKELKEKKLWDISASERLDMVRDFTHYGLDHWGSDRQGIETTRRFTLELLSWLCRYIPVGILERVPQHLNDRPPPYLGRSDTETLLGSLNASDWMKISEMFLGPPPSGYSFVPKHKSNAWESSK